MAGRNVGGGVAAGCGGLSLAGLLVSVGLVVWLGSVVVDDLGSSGSSSRGTRSKELDVAVAPATRLTDGATVFVTSTAFEPHELVGVAVCLREAETKRRGIAACDTVSGTHHFADATGALAAAFRIPRVITVGKRAYDCAAASGRCLVVAAAGEDLNRSGGQPVSFRAGLPKVALVPVTKRPQTDLLPVTGAPTGALAPSTRVAVTASGFQPGEPVIIGRCTDRFARHGIAYCEPTNGPDDGLTALLTRQVTGDTLRADGRGVVEVRVAVAAEVTEFAHYDVPTRCASRPGRCAIVVAAIADTRRSAVLPYTVTGG